MIGELKNLEGTRMLFHENNGTEIRFIDDKTGDVYYKKLTDHELEVIGRFLIMNNLINLD